MYSILQFSYPENKTYNVVYQDIIKMCIESESVNYCGTKMGWHSTAIVLITASSSQT